MGDQIRSLADVDGVRVDGPRLHSATHEEILQGATADIYFVKTLEVLRHLGLEEERVTAEVFARRPGVLAGVEECRLLLQDKGVDVWALPEGSTFEAREVVMRIEGPYSRFGVYETALLGSLASATGWATAAREAKGAAPDKPVICFGARHVHPAVASVMERAAIVGGCDGSASILGAKLVGQEPVGTTPHALFLIVGDSVVTAQAYDETMPEGGSRTILVDTFKDEVEESLRVAAALGDRLEAVRLDTPGERGGVTPGLVTEVRARLDLAGYPHVRIFVSGGLSPERISLLAEAGADAFGVGSYISRAAAIDMTMDIKELNGDPIAKRGRIPGRKSTDRLQRLV